MAKRSKAKPVVSGERKSVRLGLRDEHAKVGDHIAYFWETPREFGEGVRFLEVGIDEGDFCVIFGHDEGNLKVLDTLKGTRSRLHPIGSQRPVGIPWR